MRILYDGHIFRWHGVGGIRRYFSELITRLPDDWEPAVLGTNPADPSLPRHPRLAQSAMSRFKPRRYTQSAKCAWWKLRYARGAALLHPTFYNLTGGLRFADFRCPIVVTAHDFIQRKFAHLEGGASENVRLQTEALAHATQVVCVSKFTEQDLLEAFPHMAGRTTVIDHGSSFPVCAPPPPERVFEPPTFLFVGRRETYKNFWLLLRAFARACQSHPGIRLHLVGPPLTDDERWQMHFLGISTRVSNSVCADEGELGRWYRQCVALLYPSRHEGFGMPPLEAMACGTLAVAANATSLPEVVGDGGILLDPASEDAWTECILQIAQNTLPRREIIARGLKRAATFTWERSAAQHVALYRQLTGNH